MFFNNTFSTALPPQQCSLEEKRKNPDSFGVSVWEKKCLDALEALGRTQFASNYALKENYEIIRGRFILTHYLDRNDMYDTASTITQEFNIPNYLKHYDITSKAINTLEGEFLKRPDGFRCYAVDKDSKNEFVRAKTEMLHDWVSAQIKQEIDNTLRQRGIDPELNTFKDEEEQKQYQEFLTSQIEQLTPPELEKYMREDYFCAAEKFGQHVMELDRERHKLKEKEAEEFVDMLVADRCFRHFYLTATGYNQETWNPIYTFFHRSPEVKYVEDGDYVGRVFWYSKAQIVDRYGWLMNEEQLEALYPKDSKTPVGSKGILSEAFNASVFPFADYRDYMMQVNALGYDPHTGYPFNMNQPQQMNSLQMDYLFDTGANLNFRVHDLVMVTEAYWKSQRKIGKLNFINPQTGLLENQIVDETFDPKLYNIKKVNQTFEESNEPNTVSWSWVTQVWQGIKINVNFSDSTQADNEVNKFSQKALYLDVRPSRFQFKGQYNPFQPKLPVIGGVFNNRNGESMSLVDLLKPYQIFYNQLYNQAYELTSREIGKLILMDVNLLPNMKDWGGGENYEKFLAIAKTMGIGIVDTRPGANGQTAFASSNSYQVLDASETDRIAAKLNLAIIVEEQAYKQIGITPQRMGTIAASETATGVQQATASSYAQTESYFQKFYNYKTRCLQANVEMAQHVFAQEKDITLMHVMSDMSRGFVQITDPQLLLRDIGVYPTFNQEVTRQTEVIKNLAINNNTSNLPMSALIQMATMNSPKEIISAVKNAEAQMQVQVDAERQHQSEMQQTQIQAAAQQDDKNKAFEASQNQLDRDADLRKAVISVSGFDADVSKSANGQLDVIEQGKLMLQEQQNSAANSFNYKQLQNSQLSEYRKSKQEDKKIASDEKIKTKEMSNRIDIENRKLTQIESQSKNQEKLARDKAALELALKDKDLELKDKELELKDKDLQIAEKKVKTEEKLFNLSVKEGENKLDTAKKLSKIKETAAKISARNKSKK